MDRICMRELLMNSLLDESLTRNEKSQAATIGEKGRGAR